MKKTVLAFFALVVAVAMGGCVSPIVSTENYTVDQGQSIGLVASPGVAYVMKAEVSLKDVDNAPKELQESKAIGPCWLVYGAERIVETNSTPTNAVNTPRWMFWKK